MAASREVSGLLPQRTLDESTGAGVGLGTRQEHKRGMRSVYTKEMFIAKASSIEVDMDVLL